MAQSTDSAVLPPWLQSEHPQRLWYDHTFLLVIWWWDTFEDLKAFHSGSTASGLVRDHATNGLVEYTGRRAKMERSCTEVYQL